MIVTVSLTSLTLLARGTMPHEVRAAECRAEITMPTEPEHEVENRQIGGRSVRFHRYIAHAGTMIYVLSCAWAPGMLRKGDDVEAGLDLATNGLLTSNGAVLKSSRSISLRGVAGREVYGAAAAFSIRAQSYAHSNGNVSILVLGPDERLTSNEANSFFESLAIRDR